MTLPATERRYNSGARLDTITISLPVPSAGFAEVLGPLGLVTQPIDGSPAHLHPLYLDLWRVADGRAELGGLDQHEWTERMGAATAGLAGAGIGALWGAGSGSAAGALAAGRAGAAFGPWGSWGAATLGSLLGGTLGAMSGALAGGGRFAVASGRAARRASEQLSHVVGSYYEAVIGVPNVVPAAGDAPPRMFVLGMYSDNPVSIWGDRMLAAGYRKRLAAIRAEGSSRYAIEVDGDVVLDGSISADVAADTDPEDAGPPPPFERFFAQPLLGRLDDGRLVASVLDRSFRAPAQLLPPASARVVIAPRFAAGVPGGSYDVGAAEDGVPFGVLRTTGLFARLTFPEPA